MGSSESKPEEFPTEVETASDRYDDQKWVGHGFELNKPMYLSKTTTYKKPDGWTIVYKKSDGGYFVDPNGIPRIKITGEKKTIFMNERAGETLKRTWDVRNKGKQGD
jgi:hypothetical protein